MGVEADHEEERKVMGVPESFKALLTDFVVSGSIHQHHEEQHNVSSDATWLTVVDI